MEVKSYQLNCESPLYFGNTKKIKQKISHCQSCGSKLIFQHMPNYKDLILKEVIKCVKCEAQATHQLYRIH